MNVTVSFEMEGVARIRGKRSDAVGEQTQFVEKIWHHRKKRVDDNYLFKRKRPSVSKHKAHCENSTLPPKRLHIVKPCKFDHISHLFHTEKSNKTKKKPKQQRKHFSCCKQLGGLQYLWIQATDVLFNCGIQGLSGCVN